MKKGFIKGEALLLLRTYSSSQTILEKNIKNFENRLIERVFFAAIVRKYLSEVKFADRKTAPNKETGNKSSRNKTTALLLLHNHQRNLA